MTVTMYPTREKKLRFVTMFIILFAILSFAPISSAAIKNGDRCRIAGQTQAFKGKTFACVKVGKKLVWQRMPTAKPPATISLPGPTPSNTGSTPSLPAPSPTPTKVLSISDRWNAIDAASSNAASPWINSTGLRHSVNFVWKPSQKADAEVVAEIKRRYEATAKFWEPYVQVKNPLLVLIGALNEVEWLCGEKLPWLSWNQPDCVEVESLGQRDVPTAGQSQSSARNVDMYTIDNLRRLSTTGWLARIEHEFVHNVFHALAPNYNNAMPCWMIESGAEYLGVLAASQGDLNKVISLRNYQAQRRPMGIQGASVELWYEFLIRTDRTALMNRQGDPCGPVRNEIYSHAILANEYLVGELGLPGYLELAKMAGTRGWSEAVRSKFGKSREELYQDIALYSQRQFELVIANRWSFEALERNL
jgi:hypothetical protein